MHHERRAEFEYEEKVKYAEKRTRVKAELGALWVWEYKAHRITGVLWSITRNEIR